MFAHRFLLVYFLPYYLCFGIFLLHYLCFYSIVYVSGNIPEIFITRQREKATRGMDLDTQHDLLETNRAGPGLNFGSSARSGPARQENWNFQARPGPARPAGRPARSQLYRNTCRTPAEH
jgi:hypothetical protein